MPGYLRHLLSALITFCCVAVVAAALLSASGTEAASPLLQAEPTADPCAPATLAPAGNIVNVRAGPGSNNELLAQLRAGEERPVLGRHWQFRWWQIEMSNGSEGWVWDGAVELSGNIAAVPVITFPADDDQPAEATWEPTVDVACVATPVTNTDGVLTTPTPPAGAVAEELNANDDGWSAPINLSRSGLATEPQMVVDGEGNVHVLWQEQGVDGFLYTRQSDGAWLQPVAVELPFGTRRYTPDLQAESPTPLFTPLLVADGAGLVHAFWRDDERSLQYSKVAAEAFNTFEAWSAPRVLAEAVLGAVATVDEGAGIHLGYIRSEETAEAPAGVYYQGSPDGGDSWTEPTALYTSGYMRAVSADNARVQIAAAGSGNSARIYVAWDNPLLEQVLLARSANGGESWLGPTLVDERQPDDRSDALGPSNVTLSARDDELMLLWQAGHQSATCQQHYQYSEDGGVSWTQAGVLLEDFSTCPANAHLSAANSETTLLLATLDSRSYLLAWDGERWSAPQDQEMLSTFTNPRTFRPVSFGCLQAAVTTRPQMIAVGCDTTGNDIWTTARSLESADIWFESRTEWESPAVIGSTDRCPGSPRLVPGRESSVHAFWLQESPEEVAAVHYSGWDGQRWIPPGALFAPQVAAIVEIAAASTADNQLFVFWLEKDGKIYYSQASAGSSNLFFSTGSWATPRRLSLPHESVGAPAVAVDGAGNLFLAYAVPVNEDRGIYLTSSSDQGRSWNEPLPVFNGAEAAWQIVGRPRLTISNRGTVHVLWSREQLGLDGSVDAVALHSTQVQKDSVVFDPPQMVTAEATTWYEVASDRAGLLHQFWQQERSDEGTLLWHRQSDDDGRTWSIPTVLSSAPGMPAVAAARGGDLHFLHVAGDDEGLQHWTWTEEDITREQGPPVPGIEIACHAAAAVSQAGQLVLAYGASELLPDGDADAYYLSSVGREVDTANGSEATPAAVAIITNQQSATQPATLVPPAAATPDGPTATPAPAADNNLESNGDLTGDPQQTAEPSGILLASLLPVGLLVLAIFFLRRAILTRIA